MKYLVDHGAQIEDRTNVGRTPLHLAVENDYVDVAQMLLDLGANPSIANVDGHRQPEAPDVVP